MAPVGANGKEGSMTCNACGRDVPLVDRSCAECYNEGPFTRAARLAVWTRRFAWLPVRIDYRTRIWLRHYETSDNYIFGRVERWVRLPA